VCRPTDTDFFRYLKMDIKTNPKLGDNKFLQKIYSTPEVEEVIWRKMLVTMYRTTRCWSQCTVLQGGGHNVPYSKKAHPCKCKIHNSEYHLMMPRSLKSLRWIKRITRSSKRCCGEKEKEEIVSCCCMCPLSLICRHTNIHVKF